VKDHAKERSYLLQEKIKGRSHPFGIEKAANPDELGGIGKKEKRKTKKGAVLRGSEKRNGAKKRSETAEIATLRRATSRHWKRVAAGGHRQATGQ